MLGGCLALVAVVGSTACGEGTSTGSGDAPAVMATTPVWADVTSHVLCGDVEVESIVPLGADPHSFEPSVQDADRLRSVDLVVANGLGLEEGLRAPMQAAEESGAVVLEVAPSLDPLAGDAGHDDEGHGDEEEEHHADDGHDHDIDPHVWMDPDRVADAVPSIAEALGDVEGLPVDAARIDECAAAYAAELRALGEEMDRTLAAVPGPARRLVTNHESLGYLADRFDFEIVGAVVPSTSSLGEASARDLDDLAETMREVGVTTIFADAAGSTEVSEGLAERLGPTASVVPLAVESMGDGDAATYVEMMRSNAATIAEHLGGSAPR